MGASEAADIVFKVGGWIIQKMIDAHEGPEWLKYAQMGVAFAPKAKDIILGIIENRAGYDNMTPELIFSTLTAIPVEQIEEQAKRELGIA